MRARKVLDRTTTPDEKPLELSYEGEQFVIRVDGVPLMGSAAVGSEQAMAQIAAELLGTRKAPRVLVGGLGMGFTLRAVLDAFASDASVVVAELMPALVGYARGVLAHLAARPLDDPRVQLHLGDVHEPIARGPWDAVLLDVDNGPIALSVRSNSRLYSTAGLARLRKSLRADGVLIVWSADASPLFESRLRQAGFECETRRVRARGAVRKGRFHWLFVARPGPAPKTASSGSRARPRSRP
jgi:spermidine synthase